MSGKAWAWEEDCVAMGAWRALGLVGAKPYSLKASSLKAHLGPLLAMPPAPKSLQLPEISVQTHESVEGCFTPKPWQQISRF